jgi:hypothetical protein
VWCLLSFGYRNDFDARRIMLSLNAYFDKCLEIIAIFDDFTILHVFRYENICGERFSTTSIRFSVESRKSYILKKPNVPICHSGYSGL